MLRHLLSLFPPLPSTTVHSFSTARVEISAMESTESIVASFKDERETRLEFLKFDTNRIVDYEIFMLLALSLLGS